MKTIKITVIIPTFNRCGYLKQAVESVLSQNYRNIEIVVADNASTDATSSEMKPYLDSGKIKYFRNTENIGMYQNWNRALFAYATGEWILILSDDDFLLDPAYFEKAVELIESVPGMVSIFSNYCQFNETTREMREFRKKLPRVSDGKDIFLNWDKFQALPSTVIFNAALAKQLRFFSNSDILSCDWADFLRLMLHGKVGFIEDCVVAYRVHPDNASRQPLDMNAGFYNLRYIPIAKEHALAAKSFSAEVLKGWEEKITDRHYYAICGQICMTAPGKLGEFFRYAGQGACKKYLLSSPRNIVKFFLGTMRGLFSKAGRPL